MKSSQINFFLMPEELVVLENYLKENQWLMVAHKMENSNLKILNSIQESSFKYLIQKEHKNLIINNLNIIDDLRSPVIEFWESSLNNLEMKRGRLYYNSNFYDAEKKLIEKNTDFLVPAENLFKWFRKTFKNTKIEAWKGFFISQKTDFWVKNQNGKLIDC